MRPVHPDGRICFLTSNFPRWEGDSTTPFVLHMAQDLNAAGWEIEVLAPHAPGAARHEILGGIAVTRFRYLWPESAESVCYQGGALVNLRRNPVNWLKLPALVLAEAVALWRLTRWRRFDIIHAHWILPQGFVGVLVGKCLGVPCVITVHGSDVFALRGRIFAAFKRYALTRSAVVTANSSATEAAVRTLAPGLAVLRRIPMGAQVSLPSDAHPSTGIRARFAVDGAPLIVFVGRLVEEKGVGDLLEAIAHLHNEGLRVQAILLGEGQERSRFEALAAKLGLAKAVHFLGWVAPDEVPAHLAAADIFVAPSKTGVDGSSEGQGLTIVEAQLAGVPVIATGIGGVVDLVEDGDTGVLVPPASPQNLAAAIVALCRDPALGARLAAKGRAHAEAHFTRAGTTASFGEVYNLLREAAGKSASL